MLITHEMHVIQSICDRVAVIHAGGIVEEGPVTEVFLKPKHFITKEFVNRDSFSGEHAVYRTGQKWKRLVHITYLGSKTYESTLSQVVRETGVDFAILQGAISTIKDTPYGKLIVALEGTEDAVQQTIQKLQEHDLDVEVME